MMVEAIQQAVAQSNPDPILTQLTASAMIVWALQQLKRAKSIPWVNANTDKLNRTLALVGSGLTAVGIHYTFDHTAGVLTITGLTVVGIASGAWHWFQSYVVQETMYRATVYKAPAVEDKPKAEGKGAGAA